MSCEVKQNTKLIVLLTPGREKTVPHFESLDLSNFASQPHKLSIYVYITAIFIPIFLLPHDLLLFHDLKITTLTHDTLYFHFKSSPTFCTIVDSFIPESFNQFLNLLPSSLFVPSSLTSLPHKLLLFL